MMDTLPVPLEGDGFSEEGVGGPDVLALNAREPECYIWFATYSLYG